MSHNPYLYDVWAAMKSRCNNPRNKSYKNYGGRGITVCPEWNNSYKAFEQWALSVGYMPNGVRSIDRIDNDKGYSPDNCRVADRLTQNRNSRQARLVTAFGETKSVIEWTEDSRCQVGYKALIKRLNTNVNPEIAISKPSRGY